MSYIVIETFGGPQYVAVISGPDGTVYSYDTREEAEKDLDEFCQKGIIVEIED